MRNVKIIIALILAVAVAAIGYRVLLPKKPSRVNVVEYESDMTEALLRQIFQEPGNRHASAYFVAFGELLTPPSYSFMARFSGQRPAVKAFTSAAFPPIGKILEVSTGRAGVIVQVIAIKPVFSGHCDVEVVLSNLPADQNRFIYRIANEGGDWRVKSRKPA